MLSPRSTTAIPQYGLRLFEPVVVPASALFSLAVVRGSVCDCCGIHGGATREAAENYEAECGACRNAVRHCEFSWNGVYPSSDSSRIASNAQSHSRQAFRLSGSLEAFSCVFIHPSLLLWTSVNTWELKVRYDGTVTEGRSTADPVPGMRMEPETA
jgi:hypothetical protein